MAVNLTAAISRGEDNVDEGAVLGHAARHLSQGEERLEVAVEGALGSQGRGLGERLSRKALGGTKNH